MQEAWQPGDECHSHDDVRRAIAWCRNGLTWRLVLLNDAFGKLFP